MQFFFADESYRNNPERDGMGSLVATGGVAVQAEFIRTLEQSIDEICVNYGFPKGEEFKWSPGKDAWMRDGLKGAERTSFFSEILGALSNHSAKTLIVIVDKDQPPATDAPSPELDATNLLLERVERRLTDDSDVGAVVVDRPGGNLSTEREFLLETLETVQRGTKWVTPSHIALSVLAADSHLIRLLQAADLVVSSAASFVSGERKHSPPLFPQIREMLYRRDRRIGGIGLKMYPERSYANLYHWLLGDSNLGQMWNELALPSTGLPYSNDQHMS